MRQLSFTVEKEYDGIKVSNYLRFVKKFSYSLIVKLRHSKDSILLNGVPIRTIDIINVGDNVVVFVPENGTSEFPNFEIDVDIVYEDEDLIVFDKPYNMPVHPSKNHLNDTLANYCAAHYPDIEYRVIGRLDKDTSGLVIVAKNKYSAATLTNSKIEKEYIAIAEGYPEETEYKIDLPIDDSKPEECRRFVGENGKQAQTDFFVTKKGNGLFAATVKPKTGRTHQIRVHMSYLGFPLCGDVLYGGKDKYITRHALHRNKLTFLQPFNHKRIEVESALPKDMQNLIYLIDSNEKY